LSSTTAGLAGVGAVALSLATRSCAWATPDMKMTGAADRAIVVVFIFGFSPREGNGDAIATARKSGARSWYVGSPVARRASRSRAVCKLRAGAALVRFARAGRRRGGRRVQVSHLRVPKPQSPRQAGPVAPRSPNRQCAVIEVASRSSDGRCAGEVAGATSRCRRSPRESSTAPAPRWMDPARRQEGPPLVLFSGPSA